MTIQVDGMPLGGDRLVRGRRVVDVFAQRCGRPGDLLRNGCDFGRDVEWRRQGERCSAGGRQQVQRIVLRQFCDQRHVERAISPTDLKARGAQAPAGFDKLWDESAGVRRPDSTRPDVVFLRAPHARQRPCRHGLLLEGPARRRAQRRTSSRPLHSGGWDLDNQVRVTAQVTPRNKVSGFFDKVNKCNCPTVLAATPLTGESATRLTYPSVYLTSVSWQAPITLEAALGLGVLLQPSRTTSGRPSLLALRRRRPLAVLEPGDLPASCERRIPVISSVFPAVFSRAAKINHQNYLRAGVSPM